MTFSAFGALGQLRGFRTEFDNTSFGGGVDPNDANLTEGFFGNLTANGMDLDITYRPPVEALHAFSIEAQATYQTSTFSNASTRRHHHRRPEHQPGTRGLLRRQDRLVDARLAVHT